MTFFSLRVLSSTAILVVVLGYSSITQAKSILSIQSQNKSRVLKKDPSSSQRKYALIIGIKGYPNFLADKQLKFADNDAQAFAEFIQTDEGGSFPLSNIRILLNEKATRSAVSAEFNWLNRLVRGDDLVYIFFSGHGVVDEAGQGFLMPYDGDPNDPGGQGWRADQFVADVKARVPAKQTVLFVDACHAGAMAMKDGQAKDGGNNVSLAIRKAWLAAFETQDKNDFRMALLSAASNQRSWEDNDFKGGIFTHYLLEALNGAADSDKDRTVTAIEAYRYVLDQVMAHAQRKFNAVQSPMTTASFQADFPLAILSKDPRQPRPISKELGIGVEGTVWDYKRLDGESYVLYFLPRGKLRYENRRKQRFDGLWNLDGDEIFMVTSNGAETEFGTVRDGRMDGEGDDEMKGYRWEAIKRKP
jgi:hypothetical protein